MDKKVSFIGLGAMGGPMAINIIKKGIDLFVYDVDENKINKVVKEVLKTNQKTILLVIYNSQNQRRYIGIKLD